MKYLKLIVCLVLLGCFCFACYNAGKSTALNEVNGYFDTTETLLDSIAAWDNTFSDTVMETDTYSDYEEARDSLLGISE